MDLKQFQKDAIKTESQVDAVQVDLKYLAAVLQIFVASGNLLDQIKKNVFYNKPIEVDERASWVKSIIEAMDTKELFKEDPTTNKEILDVNARLFHAIIGVATESTELIENLSSGNKLDVINVLEEMSDINWYQAIAIDEVHADWDQMLSTVISKLKSRYPDKFTSDDAINRDLHSERQILDTMTHESENTSTKAPNETVVNQ